MVTIRYISKLSSILEQWVLKNNTKLVGSFVNFISIRSSSVEQVTQITINLIFVLV